MMRIFGIYFVRGGCFLLGMFCLFGVDGCGFVFGSRNLFFWECTWFFLGVGFFLFFSFWVFVAR